jgi:hypothetical protein
VRYVAEKYGLTIDQVKKLIARVGNNREKIKATASGFRFPDKAYLTYADIVPVLMFAYSNRD